MKPAIHQLQTSARFVIVAVVLLAFLPKGRATSFDDLCLDRAAIERVYHEHRLGTKPAFEDVLPSIAVEKLVRGDLEKEAVLMRVYAVAITPAMVAVEVERIERTTRAPEILVQIKAVLGHDATRFGRAVVRPILVERELRAHFASDNELHAPQRRTTEQARENLLAGKQVDDMRDVTWQLAARSEPQTSATTIPSQAQASSSAYTVRATAQFAQVIAAPGDQAGPETEKMYFEDLDPELQKILVAQLQKPGDVSAVIETPSGFLVFRAARKTAETLSVASLSISKCSYDEWLEKQPEHHL